jgi:hypothetical protein
VSRLDSPRQPPWCSTNDEPYQAPLALHLAPTSGSTRLSTASCPAIGARGKVGTGPTRKPTPKAKPNACKPRPKPKPKPKPNASGRKTHMAARGTLAGWWGKFRLPRTGVNANGHNILMAVAGGLRMRGAAEAWTATVVSLTAAACPLPLHLRFDLPRNTLGGQSATPSMHPCCPRRSTLDTRDRLANLNSRCMFEHNMHSLLCTVNHDAESRLTQLGSCPASHGCNRQQTATVAGLQDAPGSGLRRN